MYILPICTDTMRREINTHRERTVLMNIRLKNPHYGKSAAWVLLLLLLPAVAVRVHQEHSAAPVGANENISIYYIPNAAASQENQSEDYVNSRFLKKYVIRLYEDTVAIFDTENPVPLYTVASPVHPLPETDLLLLQSGIYAETLEEAYRLIEDYE